MNCTVLDSVHCSTAVVLFCSVLFFCYIQATQNRFAQWMWYDRGNDCVLLRLEVFLWIQQYIHRKTSWSDT
eukprot:SAG31_NODE_60_length_29419_cov_39.876398_30_plen_71_part_00